MTTPLICLSILVQGEAPNPHLLPLGRPGTVVVQEGQTVDLRTGKIAGFMDIAKEAKSAKFVYVGESHDNRLHHLFQAGVIETLALTGRQVVVGFEMFTRPAQMNLDPWTLGLWTRDEFIEKSDWKKQWGFDFGLYEPIFNVVRKYRLPMVALNVPRDWVRAVGKGGPSGLPSDAKDSVPALDLSNQDHRSLWVALMGGHPPMGENLMENMYAAQVLWDTAMADSAIKYMDSHAATKNTVMVVVAGSGHVMYGQGINYRVWKRTGERGITAVAVDPDEDGKAKVSKGLGDFVYCATKPGSDSKVAGSVRNRPQ